jgi:phospholipid/cholesterol/gamma-HCH transport system substrate-binding protein
METRANYVLIGAFTLAGIVAAVGFLLWLAKVEVDRQYAYYDVRFDNVAGLGQAGDVRYNGLQVGRVISLGLDPDDPSTVRVRLEVAAETPIRADTVARLESQGVTGVSYVALSGGSPAAEPLPQGSVIPSEPSALQSVLEGAPLVLEQTVALLEKLNAVVGDDNRAAIDTLLGNLASASTRLDGMLASFEGVQGNFDRTMRSVATLAEELAGLSGTAETTLTTATRALETADATLGTLNESVTTDVTALLRDMRRTTQTADSAIAAVQGDLAALVGDVRQTARTASGTIETVGGDMAALVGETRQAAQTAGRVMETLGSNVSGLVADARGTLASADRAIAEAGAGITGVVARVDGLARQGEATLASLDAGVTATLATADETLRVVTEAAASAQTTMGAAGRTFSAVNAVLDEHLDPVVSDIRRAVTGLADAVDRAATDFATLSEDGRAALVQVTDTFERANATLAATDEAARATARTMTTANTTFTAVNRVVEDDVATVTGDIRQAVAMLTAAVESTTADITSITGDLRRTANQAAGLMGTVNGIVTDNRRPVSDFLRVGLPEFVRFTEDARHLVRNLERLVDRIERDPARFLLGTQAREFRR